MLFRVQRHFPIKSVATEVRKLAARITIVLQRIKRLARVILRVAPRGHTLVALDRIDALIMQLLVRHDVVGQILIVQPSNQMAIGLEMAQPRTRTIGKGPVTRLHIEQWTLM